MTVLTNERGGALMIALAIMALLTIVAVMALDRSNTDIDLSFNQLHDEQAFYTAEAGIERAWVKLNENNEWDTGFVNETLGEGTYSVVVTDSSTLPALYDTVVLKATGTFHGATAEVEAWLVPERYHPFEFALFGDTSVIMSNSACTDSYNSDSGSYGATMDYTLATVGSNGELILENIAMVGGDAISAIEGGITLDNKAVVRGDTITGVDPVEFTAVAPEEFVEAELINAAPDGLSGGYDYDTLTHALNVGVNQTLVLESGTYFFSDINTEQNGVIELAPGAEVVIYMTGDLTIGNSSTVNENGVPEDFQIYSSGELLSLGQSTVLTAAFYGPEATFILENYTEFYGSVIAEYILFKNNVCFHYDRRLAEIEKGETGNYLVVAWREN